MPTTMTAKGQVTVPKKLRDRLGLGPGSAVTFQVAADGRVFLVPASDASVAAPAAGRFDALIGAADAGLSTDQIMAMTRGALSARPRLAKPR